MSISWITVTSSGTTSTHHKKWPHALIVSFRLAFGWKTAFDIYRLHVAGAMCDCMRWKNKHRPGAHTTKRHSNDWTNGRTWADRCVVLFVYKRDTPVYSCMGENNNFVEKNVLTRRSSSRSRSRIQAHKYTNTHTHTNLEFMAFLTYIIIVAQKKWAKLIVSDLNFAKVPWAVPSSDRMTRQQKKNRPQILFVGRRWSYRQYTHASRPLFY